MSQEWVRNSDEDLLEVGNSYGHFGQDTAQLTARNTKRAKIRFKQQHKRIALMPPSQSSIEELDMPLEKWEEKEALDKSMNGLAVVGVVRRKNVNRPKTADHPIFKTVHRYRQQAIDRLYSALKLRCRPPSSKRVTIANYFLKRYPRKAVQILHAEIKLFTSQSYRTSDQVVAEGGPSGRFLKRNIDEPSSVSDNGDWLRIDQSVDVSDVNRKCVERQLMEIGAHSRPHQCLQAERCRLGKLLRVNHALHEFLRQRSKSDIKKVYETIGCSSRDTLDRKRAVIANYLFSHYPSGPISGFVKLLNGVDLQPAQEKQTNPFHEERQPESAEHERESQTETDDITRLRQIRGRGLLSVNRNMSNGIEISGGNPLIKAGRRMHGKLKSMERSVKCTICQESWFDLRIGPINQKCHRCATEKKKLPGISIFSAANDMIPGNVPVCLQRLNTIEEAAIKLICPTMTIYRRRGGTLGYRGNSIAFEQDVNEFVKRLPRTPQELPIIILQSKNSPNPASFKANACHILEALLWLKEHNPWYANIEISQGNLDHYSQDPNHIVSGIPNVMTENDEINNNDTVELNPSEFMDETELGALLQEELLGDFPMPDSVVSPEEQRRPVNDMIKEVTNDLTISHERTMNDYDQDDIHRIDLPTRNNLPASEFIAGYFSKAFPRLFPDGKADFRSVRPVEVKSFRKYLIHLLRYDNRFAQDDTFVLVASNQLLRREALSIGNLVAQQHAKELTVRDLKTSVANGDERVMKNLQYMFKVIKGTPQYFASERNKAASFIRHIRLRSNDTEMCTVFATFSPADLHWPDLHDKLPGSEAYLGKIIVDNEHDIPKDARRDNYLTKVEDHRLRSEAVNKNAHYVVWYFKERLKILFDEVLSVLGLKDHLTRFEFQNRGAIHAHCLMIFENSVSYDDIQAAFSMIVPHVKDLQELVLTATTEDEKRRCEQMLAESSKKEESRKKLVDFFTNVIGISAVHPNMDPKYWPAPYGQDIQAPATNCLRRDFLTISDEELNHDYNQLVNRVMIHKCRTSYCIKSSKDQQNKHPEGSKAQCRFGFPQDYFGFTAQYSDEERTILEEVLRVTTTDGEPVPPSGANFVTKESKVELKFLRNHPMLVKHIKELLSIWRANIDTTAITSWRHLMNYVMKYVTKAEVGSTTFQSVFKAATEQATEDTPVRKVLGSIAIKSVTGRDWSRPECFMNIGITDDDYVKYSLTPRYANLYGNRRVKKSANNETESATVDDYWHEVYWKRENDANYLKACEEYDQTRWPRHPKDVSLWEFMAFFNKNWTPSGHENFVCFTPAYAFPVKKGSGTEKDVEKYETYCKHILLQHKPGSTPETAGQGFRSFEEELRDFVENSPLCRPLVRQDFECSQLGVQLEEQDDEELDPRSGHEGDEADDDLDEPWMRVFRTTEVDANLVEEAEYDIEDECYDNEEFVEKARSVDWSGDGQMLGLTEGAIKDCHSWIEDQKSQFSLTNQRPQNDVDPSRLNAKQRKAYDLVTRWIDDKLANPDETKPLLLNISGRAGCGKSFLLNCITKYCHEIGKPNFMKIAAPTGTAAFHVNGTTLHSLLRLPVNSRQQMSELVGESLKSLQESLKEMHLLAIDEKSMVSLSLLHQIHQRLGEAKPLNKGEIFGAVAIILLGDFAQLPPVMDQPLYMNEHLKDNQLRGHLLYCQFTHSIILDQVMRQTGDDQAVFRNLLGRLADGTFTRQDWEYLLPCYLYDASWSEERRKEFRQKATMLCALNKDTERFNIERMKQLGTDIAPIVAENNCSVAQNARHNTAGGLHQSTIIAKGGKVMLTTNLWKEAGLTNGMTGTVKYIIYRREPPRRPPMLPDVVLVKFDEYTGPSFLPDESNIVPIVPVARYWREKQKDCRRNMIPLQPGYAISIHKSQGMSLDTVLLALGPAEFACGLAYTAISRCRTFRNLAFEQFPDEYRIRSIFRRKVFKKRLQEDQRLKDMEEETLAVLNDS